MGIKGFQGTSLLDFPGRIASLVFWGGCNLACPFCHNPPLVLDPGACPDIDTAEVLSDLAKRKTFIDGVVVSGGEPTLDNGLPVFLSEVKALGLDVKLDTNGLAPQVTSGLIEQGLVDYLAIDLKTTPERYRELHPGKVFPEHLLETVRACYGAPVELEYRTTCVPGFVNAEDVRLMGEAIRGAKRWVFQQFLAEHSLDDNLQELESYPEETIRQYAEIGGK